MFTPKSIKGSPMSEKILNKDEINLNIYLEYLNEWLSVSKMAEHYELEVAEMHDLIEEGRRISHEQFKKQQ